MMIWILSTKNYRHCNTIASLKPVWAIILAGKLQVKCRFSKNHNSWSSSGFSNFYFSLHSYVVPSRAWNWDVRLNQRQTTALGRWSYHHRRHVHGKKQLPPALTRRPKVKMGKTPAKVDLGFCNIPFWKGGGKPPHRKRKLALTKGFRGGWMLELQQSSA